jgi:hypothetical protein
VLTRQLMAATTNSVATGAATPEAAAAYRREMAGRLIAFAYLRGARLRRTNEPTAAEPWLPDDIQGLPGAVDPAMALAWQSYRDLVAALADAGVTEQADVDLWTSIQMGITEQQWANDPGGRRFVDHLEPALDMFLAHVKRRRRKAQP